MSMASKWKAIFFVGIGLALIGISYIGYVKSYLDEESQMIFFIKKFPTWRMQFYDPFADEGDDISLQQLTHEQRASFAAYCRYRFGITNVSDESLKFCRKNIPSYLK